MKKKKTLKKSSQKNAWDQILEIVNFIKDRMATKEELVDTLTTNAITAYENSGGTQAAKLGDFNDESYENFGGGESVEQAVVDELQTRGFVVGNAPGGVTTCPARRFSGARYGPDSRSARGIDRPQG